MIARVQVSSSARSVAWGSRAGEAPSWSRGAWAAVSAPARPRPAGRVRRRSGGCAWRSCEPAPRASPGARGCRGGPPPSTPPRASWTAPADKWPGRWRPQPADAGTGPGRPALSSGRPAPGHGWPPPDGCATAGHPPWMSGGRSRPPTPPVRTRAGHHRGRGGPPGARPGSRPPRPTRRDERPAPPGRWPHPPGRTGSRHSWSGAGPRRRRARRCGHGGGRAARQWWGRGPRTWPGTRPPMLRPPAPGWWRRRRTSGPGTPRGRTDTLRGRWPARGCNTPPGLPTASRCRPPPRSSLPRSPGASNAPLVHCSPQTITGRA
jgi:hypothetical protein